MHRKYFIRILLILIFVITSLAFSQEAIINIDPTVLPEHVVTRKLFGNFIEFLNHYVNSPRGMWAQELVDRSFDMFDTLTWDKSRNWFKFGDTNNRLNKWQLSYDRYNENGSFSTQFETEGSNAIGIYQWVYLNDSVSHTFYIYHKGTVGQALYFELRDESDSTMFSSELGQNDKKWKKSEIHIPAIKGLKFAKLILSIREQGRMLLDEASLMPDNNVHGIRHEFFQMLKNWQPGIIRYPGGCFADYPQNKLDYCIGPLDKRKSPNETWRHIIQRMDFGLHEFMWLCDTLNAEPHITLNLENSTPEEAAQYVEYCNGDTNTAAGKLRKQNGHPRSFDVKYFEIGNEQWANDSIYAHKYLEFYKAIKKIDSGIKVIIDGNHWAGYTNFNNLTSVVGDNCDIYGYHPAVNNNTTHLTGDSLFLFQASQGNMLEYAFNQIKDWIYEGGYSDNMKQALSEWWTSYGNAKNWTLDTIPMNSSLESGIIAADILLSTIKFSNTVELAARTQGIGLLRGSINPQTKERNFFGTPTYYVLSMLSNHTGQKVLKSTVVSDSFILDLLQEYEIRYQNNYIDGVVTKTDDTIYVAVINRYLHNNIKLFVKFNNYWLSSNAILYYLWSENYYDANTYEKPYKVICKTKPIQINSYVTLLPHSFNIIAIPINRISTYPNLKNENEILFYPNPADDYVNIVLSNKLKTNAKLSIYDVLGQNIELTTRLIDTSFGYIIRTKDLSKGIYLLHIVSDKFVQTLKIIK